MFIYRLLTLVCLLAVSCFVAAEEQTPAGESAVVAHFEREVQPFLRRYCVECHGGEKAKGDLRLETLTPDLTSTASREHWAVVVDRLEKGEMPPEDKPRPPRNEIDAVLDWLRPQLAAAEISSREREGRTILRRLNRVEYENTICDLLGIQVKLKDQLPPDGAADGFDNAGAAHHTSSFLMEKYLEAAETALNAAICNRREPPESVSKRYTAKDSHSIKLSTEDVYRFLPDDEVVCFCSSEWHNVHASEFYPQSAGRYRFRISASGFQTGGRPQTFRVTVNGTPLTGLDGLISYFDAPPDKPTVFEFVREMEPRTTIAILPYGLPNAQTVKQVGGANWDGAGLAIQFIEVEGPINEVWPPESHRRLFGEMPQKAFGMRNWQEHLEVVSNEPLTDAARILRGFMCRAFRRPLTEDDLAPFLKIVQSRLKAGYTFELAVRAALKGVLISPEFLFLREEPGELDDSALACRLSYFLWSSMPDDELFKLAEAGQLRQPEMLRGQVERMLTSPKAEAFTRNFVGQWLGLREIDATEPSHILYPEFDHLLKVSMIREAELFFAEVLTNDLSVAHFVASDFSMLNGRLAKHYGIPGIDGWRFQKVSLPPDSHRGGVLTMAGVLKVTANGTTTSPVLRGAWILDRILGAPSPPPPENVSAIDPDIRGATTIREQLEKHRSVETCGVCHRRIDPPGFALESFDCIGGWRDHYRATGNGETVIVDGRRMPYLKGLKVDPSDVMSDGRSFENIDQFKQYLSDDKPQLARALAVKLIAYATGRAPQQADREHVEKILTKAAAKNFGLRALVHEIVQSDLFLRK